MIKKTLKLLLYGFLLLFVAPILSLLNKDVSNNKLIQKSIMEPQRALADVPIVNEGDGNPAGGPGSRAGNGGDGGGGGGGDCDGGGGDCD